jgi:iron(III) transport system permease protein
MAFPVRQRDVVRYGLFLLLLAVMALFLIWPIVLTVSGGFGPWEGATFGDKVQSLLRYFIDPGVGVLRDPLYRDGLTNSLLIATFTTILCVILTLPLALLGVRYDFVGKRALTSLLLVPLILPPFVGAIGLRAMFGQFGAVNSALMAMGLLDPNQPGIDFLGEALPGGRFWSIVVMEALHLYPILYLNVTAALANLDPALDEAALGLGASRWKRFFSVTLPLILPGLFAGCTIVFIWSFTELGTPLMFDYYRVTPVQIFWGINEMGSNPRPFALVVVMLTVAVVLYLLGRLAFGGKAHAMQAKASIASQTRRLRGVKALAAASLFILITGFAITPHIGVVLSSFATDGSWYRSVLPAQWTSEHYTNALGHGLAMDSITNSLIYASAAMAVAVAVGLLISYLVVRVRIRGGWILDSLAMLPLAVPGLVMAFGYVAMSMRFPFGVESPIGPWFDIVGPNPNPIALLIIAYSVRRLPYVVRSVSAGLEQTSGQLDEAALNLGASTTTAVRRIVVPLIMANIIAGAILAFSFAMLEVSDSLILAQKEVHYPITKAIFDLYSRLGDGPYIASAMGVWAMVLLTLTLVGASMMLGKRLGAIFRI